MTIQIKQIDREAAWPFAEFHCLPDRQMRERWYAGYYDKLDEGHAIRAFAAHREAAEARLAELEAERDKALARLKESRRG